MYFPTVFLLFIFFFYICSSHAEPETHILPQDHQLKDGNHLVSRGKVFTLAFFTQTSRKRKDVGYFSPDLLRNRYLGIFYRDSDYKRPVWIANRNSPIVGKSGSLFIDNNGALKILQDSDTLLVLSSNRASNQTSIFLMDTGNLVLTKLNSDGSRGRVLWQSFDYPTDTLLPGMRIGSGFGWNLTSWVSDEVPATGSFTLGIDPNGTAQLIIWRRGEVYWTSGIWNHGRFENLQDYTYNFDYKSDKFERSFVLSFVHDWRITSPIFMINELGILRKSNPEYPINSSFHMTSLIDCYRRQFDVTTGYSERFMSPGCVRSELIPECHSKVRTRRMPGYVLSRGLQYKGNQSWSIVDCEALCLSKCSCVAFAAMYHNGTNCELWTNRSHFTFDDDGYTEFYVLLAHHLDVKGLSVWQSLWLRIITGAVIFLLILSLTSTCCFINGRYPGANIVPRLLSSLVKRNVRATEEETSFVQLGTTGSQSAARFRKKRHLKILYYKSHGLQLFSFEVLFQATDGFSDSNKLGQGGFGTDPDIPPTRFHVFAATPLLIAFELLLCVYLQSSYVSEVVDVNLKIVFIPFYLLGTIIMIDNLRIYFVACPETTKQISIHDKRAYLLERKDEEFRHNNERTFSFLSFFAIALFLGGIMLKIHFTVGATTNVDVWLPYFFLSLAWHSFLFTTYARWMIRVIIHILEK